MLSKFVIVYHLESWPSIIVSICQDSHCPNSDGTEIFYQGCFRLLFLYVFTFNHVYYIKFEQLLNKIWAINFVDVAIIDIFREYMLTFHLYVL